MGDNEYEYKIWLAAKESQDKKVGDCDHPRDDRICYSNDGDYIKSTCSKCGGTIRELKNK